MKIKIILMLLFLNGVLISMEEGLKDDYIDHVLLKKSDDLNLSSSQLIVASDIQSSLVKDDLITNLFLQKASNVVWTTASSVAVGIVKPLSLFDQGLTIRLQSSIYCNIAYPFIKYENDTVIENFDPDMFKACISHYHNDWLQFLLQSGVDANKAEVVRWKDWKKVLAVTSTSYNHEAFSLLCAYGLKKEQIFKAAIMSVMYDQPSLLENCFNNGIDGNLLCVASLEEKDSSDYSPFAATETIVRKCLSDQRLIDTVLKQKLSKDTKYHLITEAIHIEKPELIRQILEKGHKKCLIKKIVTNQFVSYFSVAKSSYLTDADYREYWNSSMNAFSQLESRHYNDEKALLWQKLILNKNSYNFVE